MADNHHFKLVYLERVDSTFEYAVKLGSQAEKEILVVGDRTASQVKNKSIDASFLLRPKESIYKTMFLPLIFTAGIVESLKNDCALTIKLPNLVLSRKKVIASLQAKLTDKFTVIRVALNVNNNADELPTGETSLYLENGKRYKVDDIFRMLMVEEFRNYRDFKAGKVKMLLEKSLAFHNSSYQQLKKVFIKWLGLENINPGEIII